MHAPEILHLIQAIKAHMETLAKQDQRVVEVVNQLNDLDLSPGNMNHRQVVPPAHSDGLNAAIAAVPRAGLGAIADGLAAARDLVEWRMDKGMFYEDPSEIGDQYTHGNMNCELIGPNGNGFHHPDFTLGFFFMVPRILYRDHNHPASEFYLPLTGPHGWRFDLGSWRDLPAGEVVWNVPEQPHAMRVYDVPFLAVYSWPRDVNHRCRVVHADDWGDIEQELGSVTPA